MASTAQDIIQGALLLINAYSPSGGALSSQDTSVGLATLNDLLDSLSTDKTFVYTQVETVYNWVNGKYQYSVGNPVGGTITGTIGAVFNGQTATTVLTVNSITSGVFNVGDLITGAGVPANTKIASFGSGTGLTGTYNLTTTPGTIAAEAMTSQSSFLAQITPPTGLIIGSGITDQQGIVPAGVTVTNVGTTTATLSSISTSYSTGLDTITYTTPGDIPIARPLRFNNGFTRASASGNTNLDYAFEFVSFDRYKEELLKNVPGPWPYIATYQPTFPYGTLYVYPQPAAGYTAHIFTDLILSEFATATATYALPQGYTRALKRLLALELAPIYMKTPHPQLILQAKEAKDLLKGLNDSPVVTLRYDSAISRAQTRDAGWAQHGGFGR